MSITYLDSIGPFINRVCSLKPNQPAKEIQDEDENQRWPGLSSRCFPTSPLLLLAPPLSSPPWPPSRSPMPSPIPPSSSSALAVPSSPASPASSAPTNPSLSSPGTATLRPSLPPSSAPFPPSLSAASASAPPMMALSPLIGLPLTIACSRLSLRFLFCWFDSLHLVFFLGFLA